MKLLANENIPLSSVTRLRSLGYDIKAIGVDNPSISDKQVMEVAIEEMRTNLTYDSDYGELIFKFGYKPDAGVIFIRNQPSTPLETAETVERLLKSDLKLERMMTVFDGSSIRQKPY